jgi:hypothetical protein
MFYVLFVLFVVNTWYVMILLTPKFKDIIRTPKKLKHKYEKNKDIPKKINLKNRYYY